MLVLQYFHSLLTEYSFELNLPMFPESYEYPNPYQYSQHSPQNYQISPKNWLSQIPNDTPASQLSIPGSHDSAAHDTPSLAHKLFTSFVWKTQKHDIAGQLNMGIRFFDVRVRCEQGQRIGLCHGPVQLGPFGGFIREIVRFLRQQRSQFVMLMFQKQQGKECSWTSGIKIMDQIKQATNGEVEIFQYDIHNKTVPRVGDLRGKIWLVQAFPGNHNRIDLTGQLQICTYCSTQIMTDNCSYIIQNYWQGPEDVKKQAIMKVIMHQNKSLMRFNFIIQSNLPKFYSMKYNKWMLKMIQKHNMKKLGVIVIDFAEQQLVNAIIHSNF